VNKITLYINGEIYEDWKEARVVRTMDSLAGFFEFSATQKFPFKISEWGIKMGDSCSVRINDINVMLGYIEDINIDYAAAGHVISVAGRDVVADLVDCPRATSPNEWSNQTISAIVTALCTPFGITVTVDAGAVTGANKRLDWFNINEGETVFDIITRLTRMHALLPISYGDGNLVLTKVGTLQATDRLETGVNVLKARLAQTDRERFSDYFTKGVGYGTDEKGLDDFVRPKGEAQDSVIRRYRPMVVLSETSSTFGSCGDRAKWEAQLRAGNSRIYNYALARWQQSDDTLWQVNRLVKVKDTVFDFEGTLLINGIEYSITPDGGKQVALELVSPEKYKAEAELNKVSTEFDL
jgi:prophage tail gpP-like protein